jgi:hypothetical protein
MPDGRWRPGGPDFVLRAVVAGGFVLAEAERERFDFLAAAGATSLTTRSRCPTTTGPPRPLFHPLSSCGVTS